MARIRRRVTNRNVGHRYRKVSGTIVNDNDVITDDVSRCSDETHKYPYTKSDPCQIDHVDRSRFHRVNGSFKNSITDIKVTNDMTEYVRGAAFGHLSPPDLPSLAADALKVRAFSNPNRGKFGIGQDLADLSGAIPKGLFAIGKSMIHRTADANLWYQFGLLPLIEDVKAVFEYQRHVNQRIKEFNSLFLKGGLRRRIDLGSYALQTENPSVALNSNVYTCYARMVHTTQVKRWGVIRWQADGWSLFDLQDRELESEVTRILYGLDVDPANLWDLIPWTWLIGWFTNINLLMEANKGNFKVKSDSVAIMTHSHSEYEFTPTSLSTGFTGGGGTVVAETKKRDIVPTSATAHIAWNNLNFGFSKTSILTSLGIQRFDSHWIEKSASHWAKWASSLGLPPT